MTITLNFSSRDEMIEYFEEPIFGFELIQIVDQTNSDDVVIDLDEKD